MRQINQDNCEICGKEKSKNERVFFYNGAVSFICKDCKPIAKLKELLSDYSQKHRSNVRNNEIYDRNFLQDKNSVDIEYGNVSIFSLGDHSTEYFVENRTSEIVKIIDKIEYIRKYLLTKIGAQFEILDSIYEKKDPFWNEGGNLFAFVHDSSYQYIVIKLNEILNNSSRYSFETIINSIRNSKKSIFKNQKIYEIYKFKKSGDILKQQFPSFPFDDLINIIDNIILDNRELISAIKKLRDKEYAHIDTTNLDEYYKQINYRGLKRIFNAIMLIYDSLLYSVSPELVSYVKIEYNIWFSHLNEITKYWIENRRRV